MYIQWFETKCTRANETDDAVGRADSRILRTVRRAGIVIFFRALFLSFLSLCFSVIWTLLCFLPLYGGKIGGRVFGLIEVHCFECEDFLLMTHL